MLAVESDARAATDARRNAHDRPQVELAAGEVGHALATAPVDRAARRRARPAALGAGARSSARSPRCAPGRRLRGLRPGGAGPRRGHLAARGYRLDALRAFDLFPMTHHVECVARLVRAG